MYTATQVLQIIIQLDKRVQDSEGVALLNTECLERSWDGNCHSIDDVLEKLLSDNHIVTSRGCRLLQMPLGKSRLVP